MKKETFYRELNHIRDSYVLEAGKKEPKRLIFGKAQSFLALAACLCILLAGAFVMNRPDNRPHPQQVQVPNPLWQVDSREEMERLLDFSVPVLDKAVEAYIVLVDDSRPEMARVVYTDGTMFNKKYGTGDISGINGGTLEKTETVGELSVSFYSYVDVDGKDTVYALWEKDGFTYSLSAENATFEQLTYDIQILDLKE